MIKRLITFLIASLLACALSQANNELRCTLEPGEPHTFNDLGYGIISCQVVEYNGSHRVVVSLENITTSQAILLFKNDLNDNQLKKNKPKIEFTKNFPGSKGNRLVHGCKELNNSVNIIIPENKLDFVFEVPDWSTVNFKLPIYLAEYNTKKLEKKGANNIDYKILSEEILDFEIEIRYWPEDDPEYVSAKTAVEDLVKSAEDASFCNNPKHKPSLELQQKPYKEKKDSLENVINSTLINHSKWYSTDKPHIKYSELLAKLAKIDLNAHLYDCGNHKIIPIGHKCGYCSMSQLQIYNQLDDIFQQMRTGKLTKSVALKKAKELYLCNQKNAKRKKTSTYTDKISKFYNRIINY